MNAYMETDVLVIGPGPTGGTMSKRLSDASIKVVCLGTGRLADLCAPLAPEGWGSACNGDKIGNKLARGFDKLGWHWWPSTNAVLTMPMG